MTLPHADSDLTFDDAVDAMIEHIQMLNDPKELNKEYYRGQFELLYYILPIPLHSNPEEFAPTIANKLGLPNIFDPNF